MKLVVLVQVVAVPDRLKPFVDVHHDEWRGCTRVKSGGRRSQGTDLSVVRAVFGVQFLGPLYRLRLGSHVQNTGACCVDLGNHAAVPGKRCFDRRAVGEVVLAAFEMCT